MADKQKTYREIIVDDDSFFHNLLVDGVWRLIINNQTIKKNKRQVSFPLVTIICGLFFYSIIHSTVFAAGFGAPLLRSYLGQPLNVQIPISGVPQDDLNASCVKATVETIDGHFIANPRMEFTYPKGGSHADSSDRFSSATLIKLSSKEAIIEPAVTLSVSSTCGSAMHRTYSLLLDYAEFASPAVIAAVDKVEKAEAVSIPKETPIAKTVAPKKLVVQSSEQPKEAKKSKPVVNPQDRINKKPSIQTPPKDQLTLSNEEVLPTTRIPSIVELQPDIEQQRNEENSRAHERFAAMLSNEPALLSSQLTNAVNNDQHKIQQLETELKQLKLHIQSNSKPVESHFPTSLLILNAVVLLVLLVVLLVVGKLWLSLRKSQQQPLSWNTGPGSKQENKNIERQETSKEQKRDSNQVIVPLSPVFASQLPNIKEDNLQQESANFIQSLEKSLVPKEDARSNSTSEENSTFNLFTNHSSPSIQIEELSDFTQEAEFWVSINNPNRAIEILEPQCMDENLTMPVSLLYLLDLYRLVNDEGKYTKLRARLKLKFNIAIPTFNEPVDPSDAKNLEDYEHVVSRCCTFWNTNYILPYLESLLIDDREGERIGFGLAVYRDILFLISICKELDRTKDVAITSA